MDHSFIHFRAWTWAPIGEPGTKMSTKKSPEIETETSEKPTPTRTSPAPPARPKEAAAATRARRAKANGTTTPAQTSRTLTRMTTWTTWVPPGTGTGHPWSGHCFREGIPSGFGLQAGEERGHHQEQSVLSHRGLLLQRLRLRRQRLHQLPRSHQRKETWEHSPLISVTILSPDPGNLSARVSAQSTKIHRSSESENVRISGGPSWIMGARRATGVYDNPLDLFHTWTGIDYTALKSTSSTYSVYMN